MCPPVQPELATFDPRELDGVSHQLRQAIGAFVRDAHQFPLMLWQFVGGLRQQARSRRLDRRERCFEFVGYGVEQCRFQFFASSGDLRAVYRFLESARSNPIATRFNTDCSAASDNEQS